MVYYILSIAVLIASILLVLVVLIQNSKGGGLSSNFSSSNQIMGVRKTTEVIEKVTWTLAGVVLVLSLIATATLPTHTETAKSVIENKVAIPAATNNSGFDLSGSNPAATESAAATEAPAEATTETPAPAEESK